MTIPALSTSDKSFICSYNIGANIDFRLASGVMNEITAYTTEYIEGRCWIPVFAPTETNDHSNFWDEPEKDVVYVKVGCRISSDGYIHTWLMDIQKVSELILWNNRYNTTNQPEDDTTILHWVVEKLYRQVIGNTTGFVAGNIKFQNYVGGAIRLYLFGNYSNSITNGVRYSIDHPTYVLESSVTWYPNNSTSILGDYLYSTLVGSSQECSERIVGSSRLMDDTFDGLILHDLGAYTDYTTAANSDSSTECPLYTENATAGAAIYIGNNCQFTSVEFDISQTIGGNPSIQWYYWEETSWQPLSGVIDGTNSFKSSGVGTLTYNEPHEWTKTTVDGKNMFFIKGMANSVTTQQPLMRVGHLIRPDGWVNFATNFSKETEPVFYKLSKGVSGSVSIISICSPDDPYPPILYRNWEDCHRRGTAGSDYGIGNNSGRRYNMLEYASCTICGGIPCSCINEKWMRMNCEPNRAYIWVDGYCSGGTGDNQTQCENDGGTWVAGHYECDPTYTYDSLVSYKVDKWVGTSASEIDYSEGRARFSCAGMDDEYLAVYWMKDVIDSFSEFVDGDLDELKHLDFTVTDTGVVTNEIRSIFTKHVGVALITFSTAPTFYTTDWIISWGANNYIDSWTAPDGLALRDPGSTQTLLTRPLTHHDEFYTGVTDIEGGFLYEPITSNGFLSRDPGTETKITIPVCHNIGFDWVHTAATSNGFLLRDPGMEIKIEFPLSNNTGFDWMYVPITSQGFRSRNIIGETKIGIPLSYNCGFSWLYKLIEPQISILYHLKVNGDDTKDGLSWDNAWEHWTYMAQNTPEDYTVLVEEGVYDDSETQIGPDNSIVVYLVKGGLDDISTVVVTLV